MKKFTMTPMMVEGALAALTADSSDPTALRERHAKAAADGYKDEYCECGRCFLAHMDWVRCKLNLDAPECPFKCKEDTRTLLQMMGDMLKEGEVVK